MGNELLERTLELAEPLIAKWEGCHRRVADGRFVPYLCPAGYWTIGYGRLVSASHPPITHAQALDYLRSDTLRHLRYVYELAPVVAPSPSRAAALASFVFNLGQGAFRASTLRRRVLVGDWAGAAGEFPRWIDGGGKPLNGLLRRRIEEQALFESGSAQLQWPR